MTYDKPKDMAALIAHGLRNGLIHPGDKSKDQPPTALPLPAFSMTGRPPELRQYVEATTMLIAEAIVDLIQTQGHCSFVDTDELAQLTAKFEPKVVPVHCRCGEPLMYLNIAGDKVTVDGSQLIRSLSGREAACPHRRTDAA